MTPGNGSSARSDRLTTSVVRSLVAYMERNRIPPIRCADCGRPFYLLVATGKKAQHLWNEHGPVFHCIDHTPLDLCFLPGIGTWKVREN